MTAISYRFQAVAIPIAPVFQRLAAVAVPLTEFKPLIIAPPPIKPIPVMIPYITLDCASVEVNVVIPMSIYPHAPTATRGNVRRPALRDPISLSHPIGNAKRKDTTRWNRCEAIIFVSKVPSKTTPFIKRNIKCIIKDG
jgi:hypothetical protein